MQGLNRMKVSELQNILTSASSEEPITLLFLFSSKSLLASIFISFRIFQASSSKVRSISLLKEAKFSRKIDFLSLFSSLNASSAVKLKIGATHKRSLSRICLIVICAETLADPSFF